MALAWKKNGEVTEWNSLLTGVGLDLDLRDRGLLTACAPTAGVCPGYLHPRESAQVPQAAPAMVGSRSSDGVGSEEAGRDAADGGDGRRLIKPGNAPHADRLASLVAEFALPNAGQQRLLGGLLTQVLETSGLERCGPLFVDGNRDQVD